MHKHRGPFCEKGVQVRDWEEMWDLKVLGFIPLQDFWEFSTFEDQALSSSAKQLGPQKY